MSDSIQRPPLTLQRDSLAAGAERPKDAVRAAREFEAFFLKEVLTELRKTVGDGGLFKRGDTRGYDSLLDDALAKRASEKGSLGLAEQLLRDWERLGVLSYDEQK